MADETRIAAIRCAQDGCGGLLPDGMCPFGYGASCRSTEIAREGDWRGEDDRGSTPATMDASPLPANRPDGDRTTPPGSTP